MNLWKYCFTNAGERLNLEMDTIITSRENLKLLENIINKYMEKPKLILTVGLPGSGKSHWCQKEYGDLPNWVIITKDDLRKENPSMSEKQIIQLRNKQTENVALMMDDTNVVWCDTNLNPIHLETAYKLFGDKFDVMIKDFRDVPVETCIKQDLKRLDSVGKDVIMKMYYQYICAPQIGSVDNGKPIAYIVDIDGTIALTNGRSHYDYSEGAVMTDVPRMDVINTVKALESTGAKLIFVSGRKDECKIDTRLWLCKYFGEVTLHMRDTEDNRNDAIVKKEIYDKFIRDEYFVAGVFDDRPRVVRMWENEGLTVFNVGRGYEF